MRSSIVIAGLVAVVAADTWTTTVTEDVTITSCGPTVTNCPYKSKTTTTVDGYAWGDWEEASSTTTTTGKKSDPTSSGEVWGEWDPASSSTTSKKAAATSSTTDDGFVWGDWETTATTSTTSATGKKATTTSATTSVTATPVCPSYTATGPPEWFSLLPTSVLSSIAAEWTGGPPADWCYYTYSTASLTTSTPVKATGTISSSPYWPTDKAASTTAAWGTGAAKPSGTVTGAVGKWTGAANSNAGSMALAGLAAAAAMVLA